MKKLICILPVVMSLLAACNDNINPEVQKWCGDDMSKEGCICFNDFAKKFPKSNAIELIDNFMKEDSGIDYIFKQSYMLKYIKENDLTINEAEKAEIDLSTCIKNVAEKKLIEDGQFITNVIAKCQKEINDDPSKYCPDLSLWDSDSMANGLNLCKESYVRYCSQKITAKEYNQKFGICNIDGLEQVATILNPKALSIDRANHSTIMSDEEGVIEFKRFTKLVEYQNICDFDEKEVEFLAKSYGINLHGETKTTPKTTEMKTQDLQPKKSNNEPSRLGEIVELN